MAKIILTTGGTGGHIFPALAVAGEIRRRQPDADLLFVGSHYGPEAEAAAKADIPFKGLDVRGFLGRGLKAVPAAWHLGKAFFQAMGIIRAFEPGAIAGFGGYASFAPMLAGAAMRVPLLLHEQNAVAGASNRILGHMVREVCVSWPDTQGFSRPISLTGNPVRAEITRVGTGRLVRPEGKNLLVVGGSQGAHALNEYMMANAARFKEAGIAVLHQCGKRDWETVARHYRQAGWAGARAVPFIDDMAGAYGEADLVFCRSGASTTAELAAAALPSVLVPFPAAIRDHQTLNARVLADAGAAALIPENELTDKDAAGMLLKLLADGRKRAEMSRAAMSLATPEAASALVDKLMKITHPREKDNEK